MYSYMHAERSLHPGKGFTRRGVCTYITHGKELHAEKKSLHGEEFTHGE